MEDVTSSQKAFWLLCIDLQIQFLILTYISTSCNCVRLDVLLLLFIFFITFKILYCIYLRTKFSHPPVCRTYMFIPSTSPTFYHLRLLYIHMSQPTFPPLLCTTFVEITIPHVIYLFIFLYYYIFLSVFHWRLQLLGTRVFQKPSSLVLYIYLTYSLLILPTQKSSYSCGVYYTIIITIISAPTFSLPFFFLFSFCFVTRHSQSHRNIIYIIIPHIIYYYVVCSRHSSRISRHPTRPRAHTRRIYCSCNSRRELKL